MTNSKKQQIEYERKLKQASKMFLLPDKIVFKKILYVKNKEIQQLRNRIDALEWEIKILKKR